MEVKKFSATGKHLRLVLDEADVEGIPRRAISNWVTNLDQAYEKMGELMGGYPYNGNIITIASVADYPGGWAVAGNPILWYKPYIKQELQAIASSGTWSFGIMHELGHDFILENSNTQWVFHEEMFANFRMYYAVEKLNATTQQDRIYKGRELEAFYKTNGEGSYAPGE
ncbi:hypothetical protein MKQ70_19820 [Chitinophaga sedimenti]|uniref:hypothetical protein n=1 Tax=Chitinophaga sedimenti TaxID=2033606 RepID=UPI002004D772|nr:hypothetical protein [Chitinophaga sedimenti]MCK7557129.1 hypothetical protein [Chitinophaga sedimenti]